MPRPPAPAALWFFSSVTICIIIMKTGPGQFTPFQWTNENIFDICSSTFKMSDGKNQKSTKLPQNFCCSTCQKGMQRLSRLKNRCMPTSCHSATMLILVMHLTLNAPTKIAADDILIFYLYFFEENKAWFFMWILCLAEDSLERSSLIFSEKQWKNIYDCRLLQSWLAL